MNIAIADVVNTITSGSLFLALPIAFAAGLISFLSPCVLPLVPGYMSFITGVAGAEATGKQASRRRAFIGTVLFVLGFSAIFVSYGALFGGMGQVLIRHQRDIQIVMGAVVIVLGLGFLGLFPAFQRELRIHRMPSGTLLGAPLLGALFGLGWTPCIGPTLGAVQSLAISEASAVRGATLSFAYCLGLGLPFIVVGLLVDRAANALKFFRRHSRVIMYVGGVMLVAIGVLMVTGYWNTLTINLRVWASGWTVSI